MRSIPSFRAILSLYLFLAVLPAQDPHGRVTGRLVDAPSSTLFGQVTTTVIAQQRVVTVGARLIW